jgi:hypothetical protein
MKIKVTDDLSTPALPGKADANGCVANLAEDRG